jgi:hypothetical protein
MDRTEYDDRYNITQFSPPPPPQQPHLHRPIQFPCKESLVSAANFRDPVSSTHPPHQSLWFAWRASWWDGIYKDAVPISSSPAAHPSNPCAVPSLLHRIACLITSILHVTVWLSVMCSIILQHRCIITVIASYGIVDCLVTGITFTVILYLWSNIPCGPHQKIRFTLTNFGLSKMMRQKLLQCNQVSTE